MPKHKETGIKGEQLAGIFLLNNGYKILHRNWRHGKKEIDIIAQKDDLLIFIEIKTRTSFNFGFPEEAVNVQKQSYLKLAAEAFAEGYKDTPYASIRFDIISILMEKDEVKEILHLEDAFY